MVYREMEWEYWSFYFQVCRSLQSTVYINTRAVDDVGKAWTFFYGCAHVVDVSTTIVIIEVSRNDGIGG
ncbi:uncharacterized protein G2W53_031508 [Senna tora]|uniref:Uncharacterized protein n=1 Tax=Senna tora TaxID=362788 RepID=A0A834T8R4_9FABA|nr:uncharacterized protein G2W53_031508 [Senna tora]